MRKPPEGSPSHTWLHLLLCCPFPSMSVSPPHLWPRSSSATLPSPCFSPEAFFLAPDGPGLCSCQPWPPQLSRRASLPLLAGQGRFPHFIFTAGLPGPARPLLLCLAYPADLCPPQHCTLTSSSLPCNHPDVHRGPRWALGLLVSLPRGFSPAMDTPYITPLLLLLSVRGGV